MHIHPHKCAHMQIHFKKFTDMELKDKVRKTLRSLQIFFMIWIFCDLNDASLCIVSIIPSDILVSIVNISQYSTLCIPFLLDSLLISLIIDFSLINSKLIILKITDFPILHLLITIMLLRYNVISDMIQTQNIYPLPCLFPASS